MDKIIYERGIEDDGLFEVFEPNKITLDVPSGLTIYDFKILCRRLASAIGYQEESIEEVFGSETMTADEMINQAHIHEIMNHEAVDKFFDIPASGSN